jgi:hypothetical protein
VDRLELCPTIGQVILLHEYRHLYCWFKGAEHSSTLNLLFEGTWTAVALVAYRTANADGGVLEIFIVARRKYQYKNSSKLIYVLRNFSTSKDCCPPL